MLHSVLDVGLPHANLKSAYVLLCGYAECPVAFRFAAEEPKRSRLNSANGDMT